MFTPHWAAHGLSSLARLLLVAAASAFLAACATPPTAAGAITAGDTRADEATLVFSVTSNSARIQQFTGVEVTRAAAEGRSPQTYVVAPVGREVTRDTALFSGRVPEGEYQVSRLLFGQSYVTLSPGGRELLGGFRVTPGGLVDLGRLVLTGQGTQMLLGRSRIVLDNSHLVRQMVPQLQAAFDGAPLGGWLQPPTEADRVEAFSRARPVGADGITELDSGEVAAASRLGTVLMRSPSGQWSAARTGRLESLLWLTPTHDDGARLVAVGELNSLFRMRRDGQFDALDPGNLPPGNLLFVAGNSQVGWFVAHQREAKVTLYSSPRIDRGEWSAMREIDVAFSFWNGLNAFWAWPTERGFAYATSAGDIHHFLFASRQWRQHSAPGGHRITAVSHGHAGSLGLLTSPGGGFGGVFAGSQLSRDGGEHWQEVKQPFNVKVAPALMTGPSTVVVAGGVFSSPELQGSTDMGATWTRFSSAVGIFDALSWTPTRGVFAVDSGRSSFGLATIRHSGDEGRNWKLEYSNGPLGMPVPAYRPD
ncbi:MAG: hypothetical protein HY856_12320 [Burkholderiales bacterium]|nr:hypothetical protein [Burkholderiales bacterium]